MSSDCQVQGLMEVAQKAQQELQNLLTLREAELAASCARIVELEASLVEMSAAHTLEIQSVMGLNEAAQQGQHKGQLQIMSDAKTEQMQLQTNLAAASSRVKQLEILVAALETSNADRQAVIEGAETQKVADELAAREQVAGLLDQMAVLEEEKKKLLVGCDESVQVTEGPGVHLPDCLTD